MAEPRPRRGPAAPAPLPPEGVQVARRQGRGHSDAPSPPPLQPTRLVRVSSVRSHQTGASDSWGFFEDYDQAGGETPGNSAGDLRRKGGADRPGAARGSPARAGHAGGAGHAASAAATGGTGGGGGGGASGRGMLQFSDVLARPMQEISLLSPPRAQPDHSAVTAPTYVLEESRSSQNLWRATAGNRPPQPAEERAFFEKLWAENFSQSQVQYDLPTELLTAATAPDDGGAASGAPGEPPGAMGPDYALAEEAAGTGAGGARMGRTAGGSPLGPSRALGAAGAAQYYHINRSGEPRVGPVQPRHSRVNKRVRERDGNLLVVCKGNNVFGTTVSKSFEQVIGRGAKARTDTVSVSVSIASYRVVESVHERGRQYAQFLVIYCEGSFRDTVGVWKRYSDFDKLSRKVMDSHGEGCTTALAGMHPMSVTEEPETDPLPNAMTSWRLLKKRQRWFRCLDAGYLSLKVFLLERFLHDILFESSSPDIIQNFVGFDDKLRS